MANPFLVLGGVLHRIVGPPWRLQRSTGADGGWVAIGEQPSSPLQLPGEPPDFITVNGETITVIGRE